MDLRRHFGADLGVKGKCGGWFLGFFSSFFQSPGVPQCTLGLGPLCKGDTQVARGCGGGLWGWTGGLWGCTGGLWGCRGVHRGLWGCRGVLGGLWGCTGVHSAARGGVCGAAERCQEVQGGAVGCTGLCGGLHGGVSGGAGTLEVGSGHRTGSCHPPSPNQFVTRPLIPLIRPQPEPPHLLN